MIQDLRSLPTWSRVGWSSLAVLLCLAPVLHVTELLLFDENRLTQLVTFAMLIGVVLVSTEGRKGVREVSGALGKPVQLGFLALGAFGVVRSIYVKVPEMALLEVSMWVLLLSVALTVAAMFRATPAQSRVVWFTIVVTAFAFYTYVAALGTGMAFADVHLKPWPETYTGFSNRRFFNHVQTWTLPFLFVLPFLPGLRSRGKQLLYSLPAALWWSLVFASGARGTAVATLAGVTAGLVLIPKFRRRLSLSAVGSAVTGWLIFWIFFVAIEPGGKSLLNRTSIAPGGGRSQIFIEAANAFVAHPWFGVGPMHFSYLPTEVIIAAPHNWLLQFLAEWGLPATFVLLLLLGAGLWKWIVHARAQPTAFRLALTVALVAGLVHGLVSNIVVMPLSQTYLATIVGLALGDCVGSRRKKQRPVTGSPLVWIGGVAVILAAAWIAVTVARVVPDLPRRDNIEAHVPEGGKFSPRFWQQGFIGPIEYQIDHTDPLRGDSPADAKVPSE